MSVTVNITERQLKLGILKLALSLVAAIVLVGFVLSLVAGKGQGLAVNVMLVAFAFAMLTNGFLAALKIVDWFEARKQRHG